ncbi:MAG: deoxyribose-phosphate aldolase [Oscillospiraceae bacterium]|nr:deoxyribose-phosphate aldolase [Oscillospiraceae bacterium]
MNRIGVIVTTKEEILRICDHTVLRTDAPFSEIAENCRLAIRFNCASMCLAPAHVYEAKKFCGGKLKICTVIGFPNGYNDTATKVFEARHMIEEGADEIDAVINIGWANSGMYAAIEDELMQLRRAAEGTILKIIVETCKLSEPTLREICRVVSNSGADFIKTSTGFAERGATVRDVEIMREECAPETKIKAAGGISSFEDAELLVKAGADRLGTSRLVKLMLNEAKDTKNSLTY